MGSWNKVRLEIEATKTQEGRKVIDLATQPALQQEVQELYAAISLTFGMSSSFKLFENSQNEALIRNVRPVQIPIPMGAQQMIVSKPPEA